MAEHSRRELLGQFEHEARVNFRKGRYDRPKREYHLLKFEKVS